MFVLSDWIVKYNRRRGTNFSKDELSTIFYYIHPKLEKGEEITKDYIKEIENLASLKNLHH